MWLILLEAGIAAGLLIAIVMWTMSGRHEHAEKSEDHTPN